MGAGGVDVPLFGGVVLAMGADEIVSGGEAIPAVVEDVIVTAAALAILAKVKQAPLAALVRCVLMRLSKTW